MSFETILYHIDPIVISLFRLANPAWLGYLIGTTLLALFCTVIGKVTLYIIYWFNRKQIKEGNSEMVRMNNLSVYALVSKDKKAYKLLNKEANDAFGKVFFSQIAIGAATLWPVPFILGWMQYRFADVSFSLPFTIPGIGGSVGYLCTFIVIFIPVQFLFSKIKRYLPFFSAMDKKITQMYDDADDLLCISDFVAKPAAEEK